MVNEISPISVGMLPTSASGPQECILIMALDFRSQLFEGMARIPTYSSWLLSCDMEPAYRYHRRVLQLLQWRCPPERWWLKTPAHMHSIDTLDRVYPDARFVMTHRDVGKVLPSVCTVFEALSNVLTDHPDPLAIVTRIWNYGGTRCSVSSPFVTAGTRVGSSMSRSRRSSAIRWERWRTCTTNWATISVTMPLSACGTGGRRARRSTLGRTATRRRRWDYHPASIREQFAFYYDRFDVTMEG